MTVKRRVDRSLNIAGSSSEELSIDSREGEIVLATINAEAAISNHTITIEKEEPDGTYTEIEGSPVNQDTDSEYTFTFTEFTDELRVTIDNQESGAGTIDIEFEFHKGESGFRVANEEPSLVTKAFDIEANRDFISADGTRKGSNDVVAGPAGRSIPGKIDKELVGPAKDNSANQIADLRNYDGGIRFGHLDETNPYNLGGQSKSTVDVTNSAISNISVNYDGTTSALYAPSMFFSIGDLSTTAQVSLTADIGSPGPFTEYIGIKANLYSDTGGGTSNLLNRFTTLPLTFSTTIGSGDRFGGFLYLYDIGNARINYYNGTTSTQTVVETVGNKYGTPSSIGLTLDGGGVSAAYGVLSAGIYNSLTLNFTTAYTYTT